MHVRCIDMDTDEIISKSISFFVINEHLKIVVVGKYKKIHN